MLFSPTFPAAQFLTQLVYVAVTGAVAACWLMTSITGARMASSWVFGRHFGSYLGNARQKSLQLTVWAAASTIMTERAIAYGIMTRAQIEAGATRILNSPLVAKLLDWAPAFDLASF